MLNCVIYILKRFIKHYLFSSRYIFIFKLISKEFNSFISIFWKITEKNIIDDLKKLNDENFIFNLIKYEFNEKIMTFNYAIENMKNSRRH